MTLSEKQDAISKQYFTELANLKNKNNVVRHDYDKPNKQFMKGFLNKRGCYSLKEFLDYENMF
jgi:hypothetical protein